MFKKLLSKAVLAIAVLASTYGYSQEPVLTITGITTPTDVTVGQDVTFTISYTTTDATDLAGTYSFHNGGASLVGFPAISYPGTNGAPGTIDITFEWPSGANNDNGYDIRFFNPGATDDYDFNTDIDAHFVDDSPRGTVTFAGSGDVTTNGFLMYAGFFTPNIIIVAPTDPVLTLTGLTAPSSVVKGEVATFTLSYTTLDAGPTTAPLEGTFSVLRFRGGESEVISGFPAVSYARTNGTVGTVDLSFTWPLEENISTDATDTYSIRFFNTNKDVYDFERDASLYFGGDTANTTLNLGTDTPFVQRNNITVGFETLSVDIISVGGRFVSVEPASVQVYNTLGQEVPNEALVPGIYIVKATDAKGNQSTTKKVIE